MKPNFKDYLKATGEFILVMIATLAAVALILLAISLISRYVAIAFAVGATLLVVFLISLVVIESIQTLAKLQQKKRLDKEDKVW